MELIEAAVFYEHEVPGLAERLQADVRRATDFILRNPEIGSLIDSGRRRFLLSQFPFSFIYMVSVDVVSILAVAHHKGAGPAIGEPGNNEDNGPPYKQLFDHVTS